MISTLYSPWVKRRYSFLQRPASAMSVAAIDPTACDIPVTHTTLQHTLESTTELIATTNIKNVGKVEAASAVRELTPSPPSTTSKRAPSTTTPKRQQQSQLNDTHLAIPTPAPTTTTSTPTTTTSANQEKRKRAISDDEEQEEQEDFASAYKKSKNGKERLWDSATATATADGFVSDNDNDNDNDNNAAMEHRTGHNIPDNHSSSNNNEAVGAVDTGSVNAEEDQAVGRGEATLQPLQSSNVAYQYLQPGITTPFSPQQPLVLATVAPLAAETISVVPAIASSVTSMDNNTTTTTTTTKGIFCGLVTMHYQGARKRAPPTKKNAAVTSRKCLHHGCTVQLREKVVTQPGEVVQPWGAIHFSDDTTYKVGNCVYVGDGTRSDKRRCSIGIIHEIKVINTGINNNTSATRSSGRSTRRAEQQEDIDPSNIIITIKQYYRAEEIGSLNSNNNDLERFAQEMHENELLETYEFYDLDSVYQLNGLCDIRHIECKDEKSLDASSIETHMHNFNTLCKAYLFKGVEDKFFSRFRFYTDSCTRVHLYDAGLGVDKEKAPRRYRPPANPKHRFTCDTMDKEFKKPEHKAIIDSFLMQSPSSGVLKAKPRTTATSNASKMTTTTTTTTLRTATTTTRTKTRTSTSIPPMSPSPPSSPISVCGSPSSPVSPLIKKTRRDPVTPPTPGQDTPPKTRLKRTPTRTNSNTNTDDFELEADNDVYKLFGPAQEITVDSNRAIYCYQSLWRQSDDTTFRVGDHIYVTDNKKLFINRSCTTAAQDALQSCWIGIITHIRWDGGSVAFHAKWYYRDHDFISDTSDKALRESMKSADGWYQNDFYRDNEVLESTEASLVSVTSTLGKCEVLHIDYDDSDDKQRKQFRSFCKQQKSGTFCCRYRFEKATLTRTLLKCNLPWPDYPHLGIALISMPQSTAAADDDEEDENNPDAEEDYLESDDEDETKFANETPLERAKRQLQLCAVPDTLPCRDKEKEKLMHLIEDSLQTRTGKTIYICGQPGTGKTAIFMEVTKTLSKRMERREIPAFRVVNINGMKLSEPKRAYTRLYHAITGETLNPKRALEQLDILYNRNGEVTPAAALATTKKGKGANKKPLSMELLRLPTVVLLDEIDLMVTRDQKVLYNFFHWPIQPGSTLIVVGISNTMDLPERFLAKVASRIHDTARITFAPYTHVQIEQILQQRLANLKIFEASALKFCSQKVASFSGDLRNALLICKRAIEIYESNMRRSNENNSSNDNQRQQQQQQDDAITAMMVANAMKAEAPPPPTTTAAAAGGAGASGVKLISIADIKAALNSIFTNPKRRALERLPFQQKVLMCACLLHLRYGSKDSKTPAYGGSASKNKKASTTAAADEVYEDDVGLMSQDQLLNFGQIIVRHQSIVQGPKLRDHPDNFCSGDNGRITMEQCERMACKLEHQSLLSLYAGGASSSSMSAANLACTPVQDWKVRINVELEILVEVMKNDPALKVLFD